MAFTSAVRLALAQEAGGLCAGCRKYTGYPDPFGGLGDAAHIVAENPLGPRGQSLLTPDQRALASNGVWLCPDCHRKVDKLYPQDYSVEELLKWKARAQNYQKEVQGRYFEPADRRQQVSRPSAASLTGARKFWEAHQDLAHALSRLRQRGPGPFRSDILIPDEVERKIRTMSSSRSLGRSWQDEWSTTYYCDDQELIEYMRGLVRDVDLLLPRSLVSPARAVTFNPPDVLATTITNYLRRWEDLGTRLRAHSHWGV